MSIWKWVKWPLLIIVVAFGVLVIWDVGRLMDVDKTNAAVTAIHAQKITMADVMGTNLPPVPNKAENEATVAGIDKNNNGIRDDVELAIFEKYSNDKKLRAATLQYAMELQMELTKVVNSSTLIAVIQEEGRGSLCILNNEVDRYIEGLVFNTEIRESKRKENLSKYMTSYALLNNEECDVLL